MPEAEPASPAEETAPAPAAVRPRQTPILVRADIELADGRYLLAYSHAEK